MEILDTLQTKVRSAVQKIEELQARVKELEEIKSQYEEKMQSLVQEFGDIGAAADVDGEESSVVEQPQEDVQENVYRHQF